MNSTNKRVQGRRGGILRARGRTVLLSVLLLGISAGCDLSSSDGMRSVTIGETFEIDEGDTVRLVRSGALLTFNDVRGESRCPTGVVCFWAGIATAGFSLASAAGDSMFAMTIPGLVQTPYEKNGDIVIGDVRFKLLELNPYPDVQVDPPPRYQALIRVERDRSTQE